MKQHYDVIVVGAGPAGSTAAYWAAKGGASVLLLEKDREIGVPVRCAEGVGENGLNAVIDIKSNWVAQKITKAVLHAPSGAKVPIHMDQTGFILHRKFFDYDLAEMAAEAGAEIVTRAYVCDLILEKNGVHGVTIDQMGKKYHVNSRIVIGADGVESRVGRWAGLSTHTVMRDMETCAQVTIGNYQGDPEECHFYFSNKMIPGGYAWIFPKGNNMANVGLGISGEFSHQCSASEFLDHFLHLHFPNVAILTRVVGGVPSALPLKELVTNGLMLVGDAAHQANPLTGGGIVYAMIAAKCAGQVAATAIAKGDVSKEQLEAYPKQWQQSQGKRMAMFYRLKRFVFKLQDETFNYIADATLKLEPEKRSMMNIFKTALMNKPSLIIDAMKLFA